MTQGGPRKFPTGCKRVTFYLPIEYIAAIHQLAERERRPMAEIVRTALKPLIEAAQQG